MRVSGVYDMQRKTNTNLTKSHAPIAKGLEKNYYDTYFNQVMSCMQPYFESALRRLVYVLVPLGLLWALVLWF